MKSGLNFVPFPALKAQLGTMPMVSFFGSSAYLAFSASHTVTSSWLPKLRPSAV